MRDTLMHLCRSVRKLRWLSLIREELLLHIKHIRNVINNNYLIIIGLKNKIRLLHDLWVRLRLQDNWICRRIFHHKRGRLLL